MEGFYRIKKQLKHGVDLLLQARTELYKGLIMNDHRWRVFSPMRANKQCILNSLKTLNAGLNKVSDEDLWNIATSKEVIDDSVRIKCMKRFAAH